MPRTYRTWIVFASCLGCCLLFSSEARSAGEQTLGRILYSNATSLRGVSVPTSETILSGDVLATSNKGSAFVELKSGAKLKIGEDSSVRFLGDSHKVQAVLLAGAVVSESMGKPSLVVATSKFQFGPSKEGYCRFAVALTKQQQTVAGAVKGNLLIRKPGSTGSYIVPEGKYAAIPASSDSFPSQANAAGGPAPSGQAGTVTNAVPGAVVQPQGQGAEIPLNLNAGVSKDDVIRTTNTGRVRIALQDGSFLNIGSGSVIRIIKQDLSAQQTQVEVTMGMVRAEVAKRTQAGGSFQVLTPTAIISAVGTVLFVNAYPNITQAYCAEGLLSVQSINPAIAGQVLLHTDEFTSVFRGQPPDLVYHALPSQMKSEVNQTSPAPSTPTQASSGGQGGGGGGGAGGSAWGIGPLSGAEVILVGVGVAAAIAIPLALIGPASPSAP